MSSRMDTGQRAAVCPAPPPPPFPPVLQRDPRKRPPPPPEGCRGAGARAPWHAHRRPEGTMRAPPPARFQRPSSEFSSEFFPQFSSELSPCLPTASHARLLERPPAAVSGGVRADAHARLVFGRPPASTECNERSCPATTAARPRPWRRARVPGCLPARAGCPGPGRPGRQARRSGRPRPASVRARMRADAQAGSSATRCRCPRPPPRP